MTDQTPTPHIGARLGDIAETVIMAGDPLRAKFMAENFLEAPVQFNNVRGMLGFTGAHNGHRISVMGHGMGIPSIAIYSFELYHFYGVKTIIRVGSAGALHPDLHLGDLVIAMGACTNSNYAAQYELPGTFAPIADYRLLRQATDACEQLGIPYKVGNVLSSDVFYIGGTKVGALCGEAVVFPHGNAPKHFFTIVKQHGALMAKGRLLGVQFDTLFTDDLYFRISRHAIDMAMLLRRMFEEKGIPFYIDSPTNQQFPILTREQMEQIGHGAHFEVWEPLDDGRFVTRFATSWATPVENIQKLASLF